MSQVYLISQIYQVARNFKFAFSKTSFMFALRTLDVAELILEQVVMDDVKPIKLFTPEEAAEILRIPNVNWLIRSKQLTYRNIAGKIRFTAADLQAYIDRRAVNACAATERRCRNEQWHKHLDN